MIKKIYIYLNKILILALVPGIDKNCCLLIMKLYKNKNYKIVIKILS